MVTDTAIAPGDARRGTLRASFEAMVRDDNQGGRLLGRPFIHLINFCIVVTTSYTYRGLSIRGDGLAGRCGDVSTSETGKGTRWYVSITLCGFIHI